MEHVFGCQNKQLVLASNNSGKLNEFSALLAPLDIQVIEQRLWGITDTPEPFFTFVENALAKARSAAKVSGLPALADDSGLCARALGGMPGVHSARYAGQGATDVQNNAKLIEMLRGQADRFAYYVCVLVLVRHVNDPLPLIIQKSWCGQIIDTPQGEHGFGYDPYFFVPELGCTAAQLDLAHKNTVSHRAQAMRDLLRFLYK